MIINRIGEEETKKKDEEVNKINYNNQYRGGKRKRKKETRGQINKQQ